MTISLRIGNLSSFIILISFFSCSENKDPCHSYKDSVFSLGKSTELLYHEAYTSDHISIEHLLCSIRNHYEGKKVILDLWATWCSPCIYDMKQSAYLKQELRKNGVEIITLCLDKKSSVEKWKNTLKEMNLGGTHIYLTKEISEDINFYFKESGVPLYVLLLNDGRYFPEFVKFLNPYSTDEMLTLISELAQ